MQEHKYYFSENWEVISNKPLSDITLKSLKNNFPINELDYKLISSVVNNKIELVVKNFNLNSQIFVMSLKDDYLIIEKKKLSSFYFKTKYNIRQIVTNNRNKKIDKLLS